MARILIADDEFAVRYAVRSVLEDAGHEVLEAKDGAEALCILGTYPIDIAVVDIIMPNKEGLETIVQIRQAHPSIKVIAISGGERSSSSDFATMARSFGAHGILRKPFTDEQLLECIAGDEGA